MSQRIFTPSKPSAYSSISSFQSASPEWSSEEAQGVIESLRASADLLMSAPRAAWALMMDSSIKASRNPSSERLREIDRIRREFFLVERASELAAADALTGGACPDRHHLFLKLVDEDQSRYLEPYLTAYPATRRYEAFSEIGETILTLCERSAPPLSSLKLWCDLEMIARTPKRANQALANGQSEASSTIKKPSLATMRDFMREHLARFSIAAADFFEPLTRAAAASPPSKLAPGAPTRRLLYEIFAPVNAASLQKMTDRLAGRPAMETSPNALAAGSLDRFYSMMPECCYQDWANDIPLLAVIFLDRTARPAELSRLISALGHAPEGGFERRFSFGELQSVKDPLRNMERHKVGSPAQFAIMARLGAPTPGAEGEKGITLLEACALAGASGAARELLAQGALLPGKERFEALLEDAVRCRAIGPPVADAQDVKQASLKALPLYEALALSQCLGEAPKARRSAI